MPYLVVFGVITHSQGVITYCNYSSSEKELTLTTADNCQFLITFDDSIMYWKLFESYNEKDVNHFPEEVQVYFLGE